MEKWNTSMDELLKEIQVKIDKCKCFKYDVSLGPNHYYNIV